MTITQFSKRDCYNSSTGDHCIGLVKLYKWFLWQNDILQSTILTRMTHQKEREEAETVVLKMWVTTGLWGKDVKYFKIFTEMKFSLLDFRIRL